VSDCRRFGRLSDHPRSVRLQPTALSGEPNSPIVTDAPHTSIRRLRPFALSKSEVALPKREVSGVGCVGMPSTSDVPRLRYVRGQPSFDAGTNVVPALLGRTLMSWKTPKIVEVPVGMEINMYACAARQ
jgi:coenzyme PQQ precursor peptide PqqA